MVELSRVQYFLSLIFSNIRTLPVSFWSAENNTRFGRNGAEYAILSAILLLDRIKPPSLEKLRRAKQDF